MARNFQNTVRVNVLALEDRTTPTIINGLDLGALADVLVRPETDDQAPVIKRAKTKDNVQFVSDPKALESHVAAPSSVRVNVEAQGHVQSTKPVINPIQTHSVERMSVAGREMIRTTPTREAAPGVKVIQNTGMLGATFRTFSGGADGSSYNSSDSRAADWSSYDANGTNRADGVNDIAVGAGACADHTIAVGAQGRIGTIRTYSPTGAWVSSQFMPSTPATRNRLTSVTVHPITGEIYATGQNMSMSGTLINTFVAKWNCLGGPTPTAMFTMDPSAGNPNRGLREIAIELGAPSELAVTAVGTGDYGTGYDLVDVVHLDIALVSANQVGVDFGSGAKGYSVAIDDGTGDMGIGTRYVGAGYDNGGVTEPLNFAFDDDDTTVAYAWSWSLGTPSARDGVGFYGMTQVGTALYINGTVADSVYNPAIAPDTLDYENNVVLNVLAADGSTPTYGWAYSVLGGDYTSRAGDVTATGELVTAGSIDDYLVAGDAQSMTVGDASQFDVNGNLVTGRDSGDCDGALNKDTDNSGIAVHANGDVSVGGTTNAGKAAFEGGLCPSGNPPQLLNGADSTYGNGSQTEGPQSDGYLYRDNYPIGS